MTRAGRIGLAAALLASVAASVAAYTFPGNSRTQNEGRLEWASSAFTWRFNSSTSDALPNIVDGSDPRAAITAAFDRWGAESAIVPTLGADSAVASSGNDGVNLVTFVDNASNRQVVGGALAVCVFFTNASNGITGADIVFSPDFTWSTTGGPSDATPISGVALHESGHWMGLAHSGIVGATMFPFAAAHSAPGDSEQIPGTLSSDDRAAINHSYPDPDFAAATGAITGLITRGGNPVFGAHVVAEELTRGVAVAASITLGSNQAGRHGRYEIRGLPPGTYRVYAEPLDEPATRANWGDPAAIGWFSDALGAFDTAFRTTVAASNVTVTPGSSTVRDIAVTDMAPAGNITRVGLGTINCPGGFSFGLSGTPVSVAPGSTQALALRGPGLGTDAPLTVLSTPDAGITLDQGCLTRLNTGADGTTIIRLSVAANARPGPRTIWATLVSGEIVACTGCLEIEGPANETACANGVDDDGDGLTDAADVFDCADDCPSDPNKTEPGQCGCGVPDTDTDGDGTANCNDGCPNDAAKTTPGPCGCGVADTDSDGDGTPNCNDGCPNDAAKTVPGTCGCGIAETDSDADGVKDCLDNCPGTPNPGQADSNGNGVGDACDGATVRLDRTAARPGGASVPVRVFVDVAAEICLSLVRFTVSYDATDLALSGVADASSGCTGTLTPLGAGVTRVDIACSPGRMGSGGILTLLFDTPAGGPPEDYPLVVSGALVRDCDEPPADLAASVQDGAITVNCVLGDIFPEGVGNGAVSLADFVHSRRKALGTVAKTAFDAACGDVHPGTITCDRIGSPSNWCPAGDGELKLGDAIAIRRIVNLAYVIGCAGCAGQSGPQGAGERPGDIAPSGGDGDVNVADAVLALRAGVGLESFDPASLVRADVAPAEPDGAILSVRGDGAVTVADAVLILRAAVGLDAIDWPVREIALVLEADVPVQAWQVVVSGWPEWARPAGMIAAGCDGAAGLDASGAVWMAACALDNPQAGALRQTWRYRAPRPVSPDRLTATATIATEDLAERGAAARLEAP